MRWFTVPRLSDDHVLCFNLKTHGVLKSSFCRFHFKRFWSFWIKLTCLPATIKSGEDDVRVFVNKIDRLGFFPVCIRFMSLEVRLQIWETIRFNDIRVTHVSSFTLMTSAVLEHDHLTGRSTEISWFSALGNLDFPAFFILLSISAPRSQARVKSTLSLFQTYVCQHLLCFHANTTHHITKHHQQYTNKYSALQHLDKDQGTTFHHLSLLPARVAIYGPPKLSLTSNP